MTISIGDIVGRGQLRPFTGLQLWPPVAVPRKKLGRRQGRRFAASRVHPTNARGSYLRLVRDVTAGWQSTAHTLVMRAVEPYIRTDGLFDVFYELRQRLAAAFDDEAAASDLADIAEEVDQHQGAQLRDALDVTGRSAAARLLGLDVASLSDGATDMVAGFVQENVARIRGLQDVFVSRVQDEINEAFSEGVRAEDLAERLSDAFGFTADRAELIATDQVQKLNGQLNGARQQDLGIDSYAWRTMGDNRVRDEHDERDGQIFQWAEAPEDGHPGEAINCRCYADPVLPDELQEAA